MKETSRLTEIRDYYDDRYTDASRSGRKLKDYNIFLDYLGIKNNEHGLLLDIGCGKGLLLRNAEIRNLTTCGVDVSMNALKLAKTNTIATTFAADSGENLCFKDRIFDYVCCLGSLEHFIDIPEAISEMVRVAKSQAKFCLVLPNTSHYRLDATSTWGIKKIVGTKQQEMQEELHTCREWRQILQAGGLKVQKIYKDRYFVNKRNPLKNMLFYLWLKFLPLKYSYQFIFICTLDQESCHGS